MTTSLPPTPTGAATPPGRLFRDRRAVPRPEPGTVLPGEADLSWHETWRRHRPEYACEAGFLALFLLAAGLVAAMLQAPWAWLPADAGARRVAGGIAIGLVLIAMIHSPWGRRSGAHMNPAITLAYLRLGKIGHRDAFFYLVAQLAGAAAAVALLRSGALPAFVSPALPATAIAPWAACAAQLGLSAAAMLLILYTTNHPRWFRWTGVLYGLLVMAVASCAPLMSGFGMNPARLLAIDASGDAGALSWLNLLPPLLGMQLAVEAYRVLVPRPQVLCAKLMHDLRGQCIFRCQHPYEIRARALASLRRRAGHRR